jgi:hypothetical protein
MNITGLDVTTPVHFSKDLGGDLQMEDDEGLFTDCSPPKLRKRWNSLLRECSTIRHEFLALDGQRIATAEELGRFRTEVEAFEAEINREDSTARLSEQRL